MDSVAEFIVSEDQPFSFQKLLTRTAAGSSNGIQLPSAKTIRSRIEDMGGRAIKAREECIAVRKAHFSCVSGLV